MKTSTFFAILFSFSLQLLVVVAQRCADPRTVLPLLRAWNPTTTDHFYTTDAAEMGRAVTAGYRQEPTAGYVFKQAGRTTVPLYRLWNQNIKDHFYTTTTSEHDRAVASLGYKSEGVAGHVYASNNCSGAPLFRMYNRGATDHFYTMSAPERDNAARNGWVAEGTTGFILPF